MPDGAEADLATLNNDLLEGRTTITGFSDAEAISGVPSLAREYAEYASPRIIFYTASSGAISQCARLVTSRPAVLLNAVVSALEELRWEKLKKQPLVEKQPDKNKQPEKKE